MKTQTEILLTLQLLGCIEHKPSLDNQIMFNGRYLKHKNLNYQIAVGNFYVFFERIPTAPKVEKPALYRHSKWLIKRIIKDIKNGERT